ncbi:MAG: prephenate dehydratase [Psychrobium sp.]
MKVATLGPKGTFSELAAIKYQQMLDIECEIECFNSMTNAFNAVETSSQLAVLPIENFSEGYVSVVLDRIINSDLSIVGEILLPIQFSLVSFCEQLEQIKTLFVQFVTRGQCSEFIESLGEIDIVMTESNMDSSHRLSEQQKSCAAIVPQEIAIAGKWPTIINDANDHSDNQTRFVVLSKQPQRSMSLDGRAWKTTLVIYDDDDHAGVLAEILMSFASRSINLSSIVSRPTKVTFGRYHFLIDVCGHSDDPLITEAINEIKQKAKLSNLGSYRAAEAV